MLGLESRGSITRRALLGAARAGRGKGRKLLARLESGVRFVMDPSILLVLLTSLHFTSRYLRTEGIEQDTYILTD